MRALYALLLVTSTAHADEWMSPSEVTIASPNGKQAVITPSKDGKQHATAKIGTKKITLVDEWMPVDSVLLDDGSLLTLDHWHSLGFGKVATLYGADGKIKWQKTLEQLIGKTLVEKASHSVSSIWWRKTPLEWTLVQDGKSGDITLFDENKLRLVLRDGSTSFVAVTDLPADPAKLVNRARALATEPAKHAEAIALLDRAIAKDPDQFEAISIEISIFEQANDHAKVITLLDRVAPMWKTKDGYNIANACVSWAASLKAMSRTAEAEQKLRLGVAAAPAYPNPTIALARLLVENKRAKDADVAIDAFVATLMKAPYLDTYSLASAADFYKQQKDLKKALGLYLKGWKKDEVTNQFLYQTLAELYEELGNTTDAIKVHEQLLAHFTKLGSAFDEYAKQARAALARLKAKPKK